MRLVFIAGPYSGGDVAQNVKAAMDMADRLWAAGAAVFVPHLYHFQHLVHPRPEYDWKANDIEILKRCDAVFRLKGYSQGADAEIELAESLGLPIFLTWAEILEWLRQEPMFCGHPRSALVGADDFYEGDHLLPDAVCTMYCGACVAESEKERKESNGTA
jgi:hypothetical protein